jgi:predicted secreted protein
MNSRRWMACAMAAMMAILEACSSGHYHHGMKGGGSDGYWEKGRQDMAELIDKTVRDQDRAQRVKAIVNDIVAELKAGREQERTYHRQLYTLNASYTATPEEFTKILDEGNNQRMRTAANILGLRFKMKEQMTADEWKALSDRMRSYSEKYQYGSGRDKSGY